MHSLKHSYTDICWMVHSSTLPSAADEQLGHSMHIMTACCKGVASFYASRSCRLELVVLRVVVLRFVTSTLGRMVTCDVVRAAAFFVQNVARGLARGCHQI